LEQTDRHQQAFEPPVSAANAIWSQRLFNARRFVVRAIIVVAIALGGVAAAQFMTSFVQKPMTQSWLSPANDRPDADDEEPAGPPLRRIAPRRLSTDGDETNGAANAMAR
jgi:hypothetical protein